MNTAQLLVIDDEQGIRDFLSSAFEERVSNILTASTGKDGLALVKSERPDLVLLDIRLSDMNGIKVLKEIKGFDPDIIVIMITAYGTMQAAIEAMKMGAYDFILKPLEISKILHLVEEGLEKRRLTLENKQLAEKLEMANKELTRKKHDLEQKSVVTQARLDQTSTKLEVAYEELAQIYPALLGKPPTFLGRAKEWYSQYTSWLVVPSLILGILGAKFSPAIMNITSGIMSKIIDSIIFLAPVAIFIVLAPSVAKILKTKEEGGFAGFVLIWFSLSRIIAAIWAAIFVSIVLGLPFAPTGESGGMGAMIMKNVKLLGHMMVTETFFKAMWISAAVGIYAYYNKKLYRFLQKGAQGIESAGEYIEPWIPLFSFLIGGFIYGLPKTLLAEVPADVMANLSKGVDGRDPLIFSWRH